MRRNVVFLLLTTVALALGTIAWSYLSATSDPILREARVGLHRLSANQRELKIVLIADIHVAGPDMPPARLRRIVRQINALEPDLVLIAGDLISDKKLASRRYDLDEAVAPLADIEAGWGAIAVLGNHDHWRNAAEARTALAAAGITVLENEAVRAGPLAIGGLDDAFTGHHDLRATVERIRRVGGAPILLSHSPDPFPNVPPLIGLTLAGHTHCGQIRLPLVGAVSYMSDYGERYACGQIREGDKTLIVSAGLGTSILPLRFGAPPDIWLVRVGPRVETKGGVPSPRVP